MYCSQRERWICKRQQGAIFQEDTTRSAAAADISAGPPLFSQQWIYPSLSSILLHQINISRRRRYGQLAQLNERRREPFRNSI